MRKECKVRKNGKKKASPKINMSHKLSLGGADGERITATRVGKRALTVAGKGEANSNCMQHADG